MLEQLTAPQWSISKWLNTSTPIELEAQRGRVVLACAFQILCPGCISRAIPQIKVMYERFTEQGVLVVGLHTVFEHHEAENFKTLQAFVHGEGIRFPVGVDSPSQSGSPIPRTMHSYQMQGTPTWLLIDAQGRLRLNAFGHVPGPLLDTQIRQLLAESSKGSAGKTPAGHSKTTL